MNRYDVIFIDGWKKAAAVSVLLGLADNHFTQASRLKSLQKGWESRYIDGTLYVRPPQEIRVMLESGYVATKIVGNEDITQYEKVFKVGKMTTVGFWR